jgi:hypothetical protein
MLKLNNIEVRYANIILVSAEDALRAARMMFSWAGLSYIILLPFYAIRNKISKKRRDDTK